VRTALPGRDRPPLGDLHQDLAERRHPTPYHRLAGLVRGRTGRRLAVAAIVAVLLVLAAAGPAFAQTAPSPSLNTVIDNLRTWLVGLLAAVATLFLTIGGLRYLAASGDPVQVERAKTALKSAAVGYALAILAPLLVSIIASVVGAA
jgi:hypothetical protein